MNIKEFKSIGCIECGSNDCTPLNDYKNEHEVGFIVECNSCEAMWDEPTHPLSYEYF